MKKQITKNFAKEWVELTLCDMMDEILQLMKKGENKDGVMKIIKKYSAEIYNSQNYDKK